MGSNLTIDDIAEALGVSKTTVSRAISGKGRISKETTERIRAYIERCNFKPNNYAQGLAKQRTGNIGVIWPGDSEAVDLPFFQKCLLGINKAASSRGYDLLITVVEGDDISGIRRVTENHKVDGMILTRTLVQDLPSEFLKESGIPFVAVGSAADPDVLCVDSSNERACLELTRDLLKRGARHLALIGGKSGHMITGTRLRGFLQGYRAADMTADESLICMEVKTRQEVELALEQVLAAGADAVIGMDDGIAGDILSICLRKGIEIPGQLCLASFYDSSVLENAVPAVTAIRFDDELLGETAAELLIRRIEGETCCSRMLENDQIILRETTIREDTEK